MSSRRDDIQRALMRGKGGNHYVTGWASDLAKRVDTALGGAQLEQAFERYARHDDDCAGDAICTCGLTVTRAAIRAGAADRIVLSDDR